jgi:hypothetical protein
MSVGVRPARVIHNFRRAAKALRHSKAMRLAMSLGCRLAMRLAIYAVNWLACGGVRMWERGNHALNFRTLQKTFQEAFFIWFEKASFSCRWACAPHELSTIFAARRKFCDIVRQCARLAPRNTPRNLTLKKIAESSEEMERPDFCT